MRKNEVPFVLIANACNVFESSIPVTLSLTSKKYHFAWYSPSILFDFWVYVKDRISIKNHCCCMTCIVIPTQTARSMFCRKILHERVIWMSRGVPLLHVQCSQRYFKRENIFPTWRPTTSFFCNPDYSREFELISLDYRLYSNNSYLFKAFFQTDLCSFPTQFQRKILQIVHLHVLLAPP